MRDEREMFDYLKCKRDACDKTIMIIPSQNTAFMSTPALTSLNFSMVLSPPREITWRPLSMRNICHWVLQTGRKCCCSKAPMHWKKYFFQSKNRSIGINFIDNLSLDLRDILLERPFFAVQNVGNANVLYYKARNPVELKRNIVKVQALEEFSYIWWN